MTRAIHVLNETVIVSISDYYNPDVNKLHDYESFLVSLKIMPLCY